MLWGSEHSLYGRLGFSLMGKQRRISLSEFQKNSGEAGAGDQVNVREGWDDGIFDLMTHRRGGLVVEPCDRDWITAHKSVEWLRAVRFGKTIAYAGCGRGIDLTGMVHEWGGEVGGLKCIFRTIFDQKPKAEILLHPTLANEVGISNAGGIEEALALVKILDKTITPEKLERGLWIWGLDAV